jgi:hypothetical protein
MSKGFSSQTLKGRVASASRVQSVIRKHGSQPADISMKHAFSGMLVVFALAGAVAAFVFGNRRADIMFSNHEGKLTPLQYADTPSIGSEAVVNWAKYAVSELFTFNFNDVVQKLDGASRFFTGEGWSAFKGEVQAKKLLDEVVTNRQFRTVVPKGSPIINKEGDEDGTYTWTVQVPVLQNIYIGTATSNDSTVIVLTLQRINTSESWAGYAFGIGRISR